MTTFFSSLPARDALCLLTCLGVLGCAPAAPGDADMSSDVPTQDRAPAIQAINAFYYYEDVDAAWKFYRDVLGFETVVDYGFAKILHVAPAS